MAEYEAQGDGWTFNDASGRIDDDHPIVEATENIARRLASEMSNRQCAPKIVDLRIAVLFQRIIVRL